MRIEHICKQCLDNQEVQLVRFLIRDDGVHEVLCANNHKTKIFLSNPLYEILFDYGLHAFLDGYTREAVASMAASIERFYELYIRIIQTKHGVGDEEFTNSWRLLSLSERQLGAFVGLYLLENKSTVELLSQSAVEFRNGVIHKGKFPEPEEVLKKYAKPAFAFLLKHTNDLKKNDHELVKEILNQELSLKQSVDSNVRSEGMQITTTFLLGAPLESSLAPTTLENALKLAATFHEFRSPAK